MRMNRTFPCVMLALMGFATAAGAQTRSTNGKWQFHLQLPKTSQTALQGGEGMSWHQFQANGLTLNARGSGKNNLVLFVLDVQDGRVIHRYTSYAFAASAGTSTISGRQFSAMNITSVSRTSRVDGVTPAAQAVDAATLIDADNVAKIIPKSLGQGGRMLVMFVATQGTSSGSTTSPLFVGLVPHID